MKENLVQLVLKTHFSADSLQVTENRISGARFATKPWHIWEIIWCSVQQGWPTFRRRLCNGLLQENKRLREEAATCMSLPPVPQCMILLVLPSILSMTLQVNFKFADLDNHNTEMLLLIGIFKINWPKWTWI